MNQLCFSDVSYEIEGRRILDSLSFSVSAGESITIVGPSGSGKSTILRLASHLSSPSSGTIFFEGTPLEAYNPSSYRLEVAYCLQQPYLFGKSVIGNIRFPFKVRGVSLDEARVKELFTLFHMDLGLLERDKDSLSGGEKQRICLVRSLLFPPKVLLLDEVTSALDEENTYFVESALERLHQEGMTLLQVTHNEEQSLRMGQRRMTVVRGQIAGWEDLHEHV